MRKNNRAIIILTIIMIIILVINIMDAQNICNYYIKDSSFNCIIKNALGLTDIFYFIGRNLYIIIDIILLLFIFKKNKNKSFLCIASTLLIAKIPVVIANIVSLLTFISSNASKLTSPFATFCNVLSTVLLYFAVRDLSDESENNSYFWKFALIIGIYYVIDFVLSFLGIYI